MEERSHVSASSVQFVNSLVREVCLNGKPLSKFRTEVGRVFPGDDDAYARIEEFVNAVAAIRNGKVEVDAAFLELRTLAQHICLTSETVNAVVEPLRTMFPKPEPAAEKPVKAAPAKPQRPSQSVRKGVGKAKLYLVIILLIVIGLLFLYFYSK